MDPHDALVSVEAALRELGVRTRRSADDRELIAVVPSPKRAPLVFRMRTACQGCVVLIEARKLLVITEHPGLRAQALATINEANCRFPLAKAQVELTEGEFYIGVELPLPKEFPIEPQTLDAALCSIYHLAKYLMPRLRPQSVRMTRHASGVAKAEAPAAAPEPSAPADESTHVSEAHLATPSAARDHPPWSDEEVAAGLECLSDDIGIALLAVLGDPRVAVRRRGKWCVHLDDQDFSASELAATYKSRAHRRTPHGSPWEDELLMDATLYAVAGRALARRALAACALSVAPAIVRHLQRRHGDGVSPMAHALGLLERLEDLGFIQCSRLSGVTPSLDDTVTLTAQGLARVRRTVRPRWKRARVPTTD